MSEQPTEDTNSPLQPGKEKRTREDVEGEEKSMLQVAEEMGLKGDMGQEEQKESLSEDLESAREIKQAKVQSVFSLVRSQIRAQAGLDTGRTGMLQLVQRVTRQLDRNKGDQNGLKSGLEVPTAEEEDTTAMESKEETMEVKEDHEMEEKGKEEVCVALLQEVLGSLDSLRKEVREELSLLRLESQSYTEQALKSLEARLTHTMSTHTMPQVMSRPNVAGPVDGKKHKTLSVPPIVVTRRRTLSRTMTTLTAKSCPQPTLGPRSMSEPLGPRAVETAGSNSSDIHTFLRGGDSLGRLLGPLGPLPPALPHTQHGKKNQRNKPRVGKAAS